MLKQHMAACLVATAFLAAPALAQTAGQSGEFMTQMQPNQIRASKLVGVDIIGANNESIGDVNDLILDQQGMPHAVVVGVGGFLGIGEKNVAIPFKSVEWKWERRVAATAGAPAGSTAAGGTMATTGSGAAGTSSGLGATNPSSGTATGTAGAGTQASTGAANQPAGSGMTTGTTTAAGGASAGAGGAAADATRGAPDHGVLRMTKADLQNAPSFAYDSSAARTGATGGTGGATGAGTTAPRQ